LDNSTIMLLRLLDLLQVDSVAIAGLDGYGFQSEENYATSYLELANVKENPAALNEEIREMLKDYLETRQNPVPVTFITPSRFEAVLE
jgi:4-hydroxy 2-oxovalerate aldolase